MLKILHARLQHYENQELPDVQAGFRKNRGTRHQSANICWIIEKTREFQKTIDLCFINYAKVCGYVDHNKLWKALKGMGIPDHLACFLRNLYAGQETTVRTMYGTNYWFKIEKGVWQGCRLSPYLFNIYAEHIMRNAGLNELQKSRELGETSTTSDMFSFSSVAQSCLTRCDPVNCSTPDLPVHHQPPEPTQCHVHWVGDASNHLILCRPPLLLPSIFPSIRVFSNESALHIRWPKYWSSSFKISPTNEHPGLISFRMDWLDLLAVQGTLKSLLQHHSSKASILWLSAFFIVQLSHPYMTTRKTITLTRWTFVGKVMSLLFNMLSRS